MKKKRILLSAETSILVVTLLTGCGKVEVYKTEHESEKLTISSFRDLVFEENASPEEVKKTIKGLCLYEGGENFYADVPIIFKEREWALSLEFNADRELKKQILVYQVISNANTTDRVEEGLELRDWFAEAFGEPIAIIPIYDSGMGVSDYLDRGDGYYVVSYRPIATDYTMENFYNEWYTDSLVTEIPDE